MRRGSLLILMVLATGLAGCIPVPSVYPLYTDKDVVFEPSLLGVWTDDSGITLRLTLHTKHLDRQMPKDVAEQFLREQAVQRQLPLHRLQDRLYFT